ncbi:hypothetical protein WJ97_13990 [Burkholderia ubonensis]|uniref:putative Ig domain-containing protein n=1 Tax=Burkholderia ubonensis TaxID=101571 RepID=UPI00075AAB15|nr:putative Ig domain-containing protein [Burkholderia ubonensis]KVP75464.1 hypothetical protein WJ93_08880 [Burkholderia ubonensis]KVP96927.1 hypothetical protein WJ97_13990 [Burkholderia ubonensis]
MKKLLLASLLAACLPAFAGQFFVVVPIPGKSTTGAPAINVSLAGYALPAGLAGQPYAGFDFKSLLSVSGDPSYTGYGVHWSVVSGSLPAGLTLNSDGTLSGTPTAGGTSNFQVMARYKTKAGQQSYQVLVGTLTVGLAAGSPPDAILGQAYRYDLKTLLTVTGDNAYTGAGVTWGVVSSTLPAGLYLTSDGWIGGTPTASGTGSITARATYKGVNGQQTYQVVSLAVQVALKTDTPPQAIVGQAYSYDVKPLLTVTGDPAYTGPGQATWRVAGGSLPAGLSLAANGVISGTPTAAGSGPVSLEASYRSVTGQQTYQVVSLNIQVTLNGASIPKAKVGNAYAGFDFKPQVAVTGDTGYNLGQVGFTAANLPAGLSLNNGVLSGTPTTPSAPAGASFQVVASYRGVTGQQTYTILVDSQYLTVTSIASGWGHTCAVTPSGGAKCWGYNYYGELGNNSTAQSNVPVDVVGLTSGVASISAGTYHTCAVTTAGGVKCWGYNYYGALGNNSTSNSSIPVDVYGLTSGAAKVSVGQYHSCAVTVGGGAKCWGMNNYGQLGNNSASQSNVPVDVSGLSSGVSSISGGTYHSCAVTAAGGAKCWGYNTSGQLGNNSTTQSLVPVDVYGLTSGVSSITSGSSYACAVTTAGAKCWGDNLNGQLGNNSTTRSSVPVSVYGLASGVSSISAGSGHACALTTAGGVKCWGYNANGQLGNNSTTQSLVPVDVYGLTSGVTRVAAGEWQTCASTAGGAKCWGNNASGQLGISSTTQSNVPADVANP